MDYKAFVDSKKSLIVAPAGHGKTHTIAECLKVTKGRQLILTHTHAGIASLKAKFKKFAIPSSHYRIETISGFLQRYVLSFYTGNDRPKQEENLFHKTILNEALPIFRARLTQAVLKASYSGIFIDEYQDCSIAQHQVIMEMATILPCHILGDPLQGIFDFEGEIVNFERDLNKFERFPDLPTPHRWESNGNNPKLGELVAKVRGRLENSSKFSLLNEPGHGRHLIDTKGQSVTDPQNNFGSELRKVICSSEPYQAFQSMLIIVPEYINEDGTLAGKVSDRANLLKRIDFDGSITLLEAIDDSNFYTNAAKLDDLIVKIKSARKPIKRTYEALNLIFQKTSPQGRSNIGLNDWFTKSVSQDWKTKTKQGDCKFDSTVFKSKVKCFVSSPSYDTLFKVIEFLDTSIKCKYQVRSELAKDLIRCVNQAALTDCTAIEAMKAHKNVVRRTGRKIVGKCLGTTLLTKGLEFDTVVILDAHKFSCPKHFYVAITRCCKQLIIFADGNEFAPYATS